MMKKYGAREAVPEEEKPLIDTLEADWVINRYKSFQNRISCYKDGSKILQMSTKML